MRNLMSFCQLRWLNWIGISVLCFAMVACNSGSNGDKKDPGEDPYIGSNGTNGVETVTDSDGNTVSVTITLPSDGSRLAPYPNYPAVDTTECLACHESGDIGEITGGQGPQYNVTREFCRKCHSMDYITSQPPLTAPAWQKVVNKMEDKFGARLAEENRDATVHKNMMVDYLTHVYGTP
jgi:hypothetical protein